MSDRTDSGRSMDQLREELRRIDERLVAALDERASVCRAMRGLDEAKLSDPEPDEGTWLAELEGTSRGEMPSASLRSILREVYASGRLIQVPGKVAYVGPEGGICYQMVKHHFGHESPMVECEDAADALEAVARGRATRAAFPFESSTDGLIQASVNALIKTELTVVGERSVSAKYDLVTRSASRGEVRTVYLTPPAHAAAERFVERQLPGVEVIDVKSPIVAVERAAQESTAAAIVPEGCGRDADLPVLEPNVGDVPEAFIRFAVAAEHPVKRTGRDKTALLFSVADTPGALFGVLRHFAERGLNLRKLQSRPMRSDGWEYLFYVEVDGHGSDRAMVTALESVRGAAKYLRVLGSYPIDPDSE